MELKANQKKALSDVLFILWAGGAALLSYSLVYALRKPFTAATFDGLDFFGMDYKTATSIVQIAGYFLSKLIGIKVISEMKKENRLKFIIASVAVAELSLVLFGALPRPYNVFALFFNGLSLGCMWGVIFSFLEGRRVTDLLASLMGLSIAISSGTAKSLGLFVMNGLHVSEFWMPDPASASYESRHGIAHGACGSRPQGTFGRIQEFHARVADALLCQPVHYRVARP